MRRLTGSIHLPSVRWVSFAIQIPTPRFNSPTLVLDQAARLFRERGYAETSLRDIAAACGIKSASLYYHFASKEEIVVAVLNTGVATAHEEVRRKVDALGAKASSSDRIREAIAAHLHALLVLDDYTGASIRIYGQVPQHVRDATRPERDRYEAWWCDLLATAAARGALRAGTDLRLARLLLIGAMNWSVEWHQPQEDGTDSAETIARSLSDMALHGLLAEPKGTVPPRRRPTARKA